MVYGYDPNNDPALDWAKKRYGGTPASTSKKTALATTGNSKSAYRNGPSDLELEKISEDRPQQPMYGNKMLSDEADRSRSHVMDIDPRKKFFDDLLGKVTSDWSGVDKSKIDYSPLDAALKARMDALTGLGDKSQQNFNTSDANLESMHRGFQDHINTVGAGNYNSIADTQKANLLASNQQSQDYIQKIKNDDLAKRQAMIQNLGLPINGEDLAPDDVLGQAQASIASRNDANTANAEQDRASNLAFNQSVANSVGQQGVERRGDLAQQLQAILGKVDMAKADATSENAKERYQLEQSSGDKQFQQWMDQKGFFRDTLSGMEKDQADAAKAAADQKNATISGFAGIPQDLRNSGYNDSEIQQAMGALANVNASDEFNRDARSIEGNDKVHVYMKYLKEQGVPDALAFQAATNYVNLGSTSKYEASPY